MAFSAHEVLEESWNHSKRTYWAWWPIAIVAIVVVVVLQVVATLFGSWADGMDGFGASIVGLIAAVFGIASILAVFLMTLGVYRNAYAVSGGEAPSVARLFEISNYWWFFAATLVYIGMVFLGTLALVIPGLIIAFMLGLYPYALVSGNSTNGFSALATSWDRITSNFWKYIGLRVVLTGVPIAVFIAFMLFIGAIGGGASIMSAGLFGDGFLEGIFVIVLAIAGFVVGVLVYIFAVIFALTSDATAYRRLAPEWAQ